VALQRYPTRELAMSQRPLIVDWKGLKRTGWPYSRAETWRRMERGEFPKASKLGNHRNSHPVWRMSEVLAYFEAHGLQVTEDWSS
jgi:predicted DNA-binding transcriptional regulator AlpA